MPTISRVGLIFRPGDDRSAGLVQEIITFLQKRNVELYADRRMTDLAGKARLVDRTEMGQAIDLLMVLGGDGTMLAGSRLLGNRRCPVIGLNFGTLVYLTEFPGDSAL